MIEGSNFTETVRNGLITYDNIRKIATGQVNEKILQLVVY